MTTDADDTQMRQWRHFHARLSACVPDDPRGDDQLAELAGAHDQLSSSECDWLALHMLEVLAQQLQKPALDHAAVSILKLSHPYFTRSSRAEDARRLLRRSFDKSYWGRCSFDDVLAVARALAEIGLSRLEAAERWTNFYDYFKGDDENRFDAFDVALAGLVKVGVEAFAGVANSLGFHEWIAPRWTIHLPLLVERYNPKDVRQALLAFMKDARPGQGDQLCRVANAYGLKMESPAQPAAAAPAPADNWDFSLKLSALWKENGITQVNEETMFVISSNDYQHYSQLHQLHVAIENMSTDICAEYGLDRQFPKAKTFADLPAAASMNRMVLYVFPMYLTQSKRAAGYQVFGYGRQRDLGVVLSNDSHFNAAKTLKQLLDAAKRTEGSRLFCLENYAMQELMYQAIDSDSDLKAHFDHKIIETVPSPKVGEHLPVNAVFRYNEGVRNVGFVFDLAWEAVVRKQVLAEARRSHKLHIHRISHDLAVEVGIGVSLHLAAWLHKHGCRERLAECVGSHITALTEEMKAMGIAGLTDETKDIGGIDESKAQALGEHQSSRTGTHNKIVNLSERRKKGT